MALSIQRCNLRDLAWTLTVPALPFSPVLFPFESHYKSTKFRIHWHSIPYFILWNISSYCSPPSLSYFIYLNYHEVPWIISMEVVFHVCIVIPFSFNFPNPEDFILPCLFQIIQCRKCYCRFTYFDHNIWSHLCVCVCVCVCHRYEGEYTATGRVSRISWRLIQIHIKRSKWSVSVEPYAEIRNSPRNRTFDSWVLITFHENKL